MEFTFDKWFNKQSRGLQLILMILPFVGWIVELLIRGSKAFREKDTLSIVVFLLFVVVGWSWIIVIIDLIYLFNKGHLILA